MVIAFMQVQQLHSSWNPSLIWLGFTSKKFCFNSVITLTIGFNVAYQGVTLLAFGNGAPDVFSAITAITTGDPEAPDEGLGLGFLMGESSQNDIGLHFVKCPELTSPFWLFLGSGLLVNTVTAGLIMIIRPFTTNRRPFIKDVLFYMSAVTWSAAILIRRTIYLSDSIGELASHGRRMSSFLAQNYAIPGNDSIMLLLLRSLR